MSAANSMKPFALTAEMQPQFLLSHAKIAQFIVAIVSKSSVLRVRHVWVEAMVVARAAVARVVVFRVAVVAAVAVMAAVANDVTATITGIAGKTIKIEAA